MPMDFTVIQAVRQRFGHSWSAEEGEDEVFSTAPYVGTTAAYYFDCPRVSSGEWAILQFETVGLSFSERGEDFWQLPSVLGYEGSIQINDAFIPGGLKPGVSVKTNDKKYPSWRTNHLLVPQGLLRVEQNYLFIETPYSRMFSHSSYPRYYDQFVIDNIVVLYKTV